MQSRIDRFSEDARLVLQHAQDESQRLRQSYIGTEHLLLGLLHPQWVSASLFLASRGVDLVKVRHAVEYTFGRGERTTTGDIGLTPRANKVIELAVEESRRLEHDTVTSEHLLLGMLKEGGGIAVAILESLDVDLESARLEIERQLGEPANPPRTVPSMQLRGEELIPEWATSKQGRGGLWRNSFAYLVLLIAAAALFLTAFPPSR